MQRLRLRVVDKVEVEERDVPEIGYSWYVGDCQEGEDLPVDLRVTVRCL